MIASVAILKREQIVEHSLLSGRLRFVFVLLGVVIFALVIVQVALSNFLAIQGAKISSIDRRIESIELENKILKSRIAQTGSISRIIKKAEELGLKKPESFLFVRENFALSGKIER